MTTTIATTISSSNRNGIMEAATITVRSEPLNRKERGEEGKREGGRKRERVNEHQSKDS